MRWLVDVVTLGKTEAEDSLHVEADSWQKALQAARAQRGESAPMSGFSIELLDDGCRAVDPQARLRYEVRSAPEAAPAPATRASSAPPASASQAPAAGPTTPISTPPPKAVDPFAPLPQATVPKAVDPFAPIAPASVPRPIEAAAQAPPSPISVAPPRPTPSVAPAAPAQAAPAPAIASATAHAPAPAIASATAHSPAPAVASATAHSPAPVAPVPAPTSQRADVSVNVPCQVIFKREHEANDDVRLTYREYVFLVPSGTSEEAAEALLHAQYELVLASLARLAPGKLVNLGVFDVAFRGKPTVPPLATLMWKDWRGEPVVEFPRRRGYVAKTSAPPPALTAQPLTPVGIEPSVADGASPSGPPATASVPPPSAAPPAASVPSPASSTPPSSAAPSAPVHEAPQASEDAAREQDHGARNAVAPAASASPSEPRDAPHEEPARTTAPRVRARGEDLITDLFDSMHELHFLRDAVEGGNFCLQLAMEKIPSQAGIVHLYDINRREFLVTSTRGVATSTLLLRRHTETDALLAAAMRRRRAIVLADASKGDAASLERYAALGGAKSLMIAPVMQAGRFLGAIELLNPLDGQPYTDAEGNALMYIAEQFAEFVASRGVVTDPERISSRAG